jgi:hypothetical protein
LSGIPWGQSNKLKWKVASLLFAGQAIQVMTVYSTGRATFHFNYALLFRFIFTKNIKNPVAD